MKGRRGRHRNQARRPNGGGQRNLGKQPTRNRGQAKQQVERYTSLAHEALQAQEFVNAQNYFQHAEYYQRLLNEFTDSQPEQRSAEAPQADQRRRPVQEFSKDQQSGKVISMEAGEPKDEGAKDGDDEALTA